MDTIYFLKSEQPTSKIKQNIKELKRIYRTTRQYRKPDSLDNKSPVEELFAAIYFRFLVKDQFHQNLPTCNECRNSTTRCFRAVLQLSRRTHIQCSSGFPKYGNLCKLAKTSQIPPHKIILRPPKP